MRARLCALTCLVSVLPWMATVATTGVAQDRSAAIENSEFFGIESRGRITQRFEIYDPHSADELRDVWEMGFDQVILDHPNLHAEATATGLDVVLANWWHQDTPPETIEATFDLAKQVTRGQLRGISVQDEPERNSPDTPFKYYVDLYQQLRPRMVEELAGVRLEISYWGPLRNWSQDHYEYFSYLYESADVMRLMPYPDLHEDPLGEVTLMMHRSRRSMRLAAVEIPEVIILQTWVLPPKNKLPTIDELRVMAYQAMLNGAEVVSFFEYDPQLWDRTPGFAAEFKQLMRELRDLSARWKDASLVSVLNDQGMFVARGTWPSGGTAEIRINTNREPVEDFAGLEIRDSSVVRTSQR